MLLLLFVFDANSVFDVDENIIFFQEAAAIADKASIPDKLQNFRKVHDISNAPRLLDGEEGDELKEKVEKIE